jgi:hypothetical protein
MGYDHLKTTNPDDMYLESTEPDYEDYERQQASLEAFQRRYGQNGWNVDQDELHFSFPDDRLQLRQAQIPDSRAREGRISQACQRNLPPPKSVPSIFGDGPGLASEIVS